jgi:hypothetical protein
MGNRGRLHEGRGARDIVRNHQTKTWIILGPRLYGQTMGYLPTAIAPAAFRWLGQRDAPNKLMNVAVSSVAGPRERGHFGGAPVSEIYSTGVLSPGGGNRCNQCGVQGIT